MHVVVDIETMSSGMKGVDLKLVVAGVGNTKEVVTEVKVRSVKTSRDNVLVK